MISDVKAELHRRAHYNVGNQNWPPQGSERRNGRVSDLRKKVLAFFDIIWKFGNTLLLSLLKYC